MTLSKLQGDDGLIGRWWLSLETEGGSSGASAGTLQVAAQVDVSLMLPGDLQLTSLSVESCKLAGSEAEVQCSVGECCVLAWTQLASSRGVDGKGGKAVHPV